MSANIQGYGVALFFFFFNFTTLYLSFVPFMLFSYVRFPILSIFHAWDLRLLSPFLVLVLKNLLYSGALLTQSLNTTNIYIHHVSPTFWPVKSQSFKIETWAKILNLWQLETAVVNNVNWCACDLSTCLEYYMSISFITWNDVTPQM